MTAVKILLIAVAEQPELHYATQPAVGLISSKEIVWDWRQFIFTLGDIGQQYQEPMEHQVWRN